MNNNLIKKLDVKTAGVNAVVFLLPSLMLTINRAVSLCSFIFILAALFFLKQGRPVFRSHLSEIRGVLIAFLLNFVCVLGSFLLRPDELLGSLERPLRMLCAVSALFLVLLLRPSRKSLWFGLIAGVISAAMLISYQGLVLDMDRPSGFINAITFGDLVLLMGLLSLAAMIDFREPQDRRWWCLAGFAALAGLFGSIMTGSRGGWLALVAALLLFWKYGHVLGKRSGYALLAMLVLAAGIFSVAYALPESHMCERVEQVSSDLHLYFAEGKVETSIGARLEMWRAAWHLFSNHPLFGAGIASYQAELSADIRAGQFDPFILTFPHMHNDGLQVLMTGGLVGFAAWLATLLAPLVFFLKILARHQHACKQQLALALAGALVVVAYLCFGLTEVIFWTMQSSLFYALLIFLLMGFCLNAKENDGK